MGSGKYLYYEKHIDSANAFGGNWDKFFPTSDMLLKRPSYTGWDEKIIAWSSLDTTSEKSMQYFCSSRTSSPYNSAPESLNNFFRDGTQENDCVSSRYFGRLIAGRNSSEAGIILGSQTSGTAIYMWADGLTVKYKKVSGNYDSFRNGALPASGSTYTGISLSNPDVCYVTLQAPGGGGGSGGQYFLVGGGGGGGGAGGDALLVRVRLSGFTESDPFGIFIGKPGASASAAEGSAVGKVTWNNTYMYLGLMEITGASQGGNSGGTAGASGGAKTTKTLNGTQIYTYPQVDSGASQREVYLKTSAGTTLSGIERAYLVRGGAGGSGGNNGGNSGNAGSGVNFVGNAFLTNIGAKSTVGGNRGSGGSSNGGGGGGGGSICSYDTSYMSSNNVGAGGGPGAAGSGGGTYLPGVGGGGGGGSTVSTYGGGSGGVGALWFI